MVTVEWLILNSRITEYVVESLDKTPFANQILKVELLPPVNLPSWYHNIRKN